MKLKICGMKLNTAEVAALRPDYLGFIFWESSSRFFKGEIPELPIGIQKVGVFVDASIEEIIAKVEKHDLQAVQLHGNESPEFCEKLRARSTAQDARTSDNETRSSADKTSLSIQDAKLNAVGVKSSLPSRQANTYDTSSSIDKSGPSKVETNPSPQDSKSSTVDVRSSAVDVRSSAVETSPAGTNLKIIKVFSIKDTFDFRILEPYKEVCDYYLFDTKGKLPGGNGYAFDWSVLENYSSTKPYFLSGGIGLEDAEAIKEFMQRPESEFCYAIDVNSKFEIEPGLKDVKRLKEFKELM